MMGGGLVIKILEQDRRLWDSLHEMILQPQSEIDKVRAYLLESHWKVMEEDMVCEDGKYYPMMRVVRGIDSEYSQAELYYGRLLLQMKHPILGEFVSREILLKEEIIQSLEDKSGSHIERRKMEIKQALEVAYEVQRRFKTIRE